MLLALPGTLTSCWYLHPNYTKRVHRQFHDTEITLGGLFHSLSMPVSRGHQLLSISKQTNMQLVEKTRVTRQPLRHVDWGGGVYINEATYIDYPDSDPIPNS